MEMSAMVTSSAKSTAEADTKILGDLKTLSEKMDLCFEMLNPGAADPKLSMQSEAMLAVVGFLEASAPRMVELVEAAATGALSEEVFAECLSANDRLQKLLTDVDTAALTETSASTTAASAPAKESLEGQFDDLFLDNTTNATAEAASTTPAVDGKSTGEEDLFLDTKQPPSAAAAADTSDDDFDAFFAERSGQS